MRMWMCDPKILCRQHLLGEYRELFTLVGTIKAKKKLDGYIKNNCLELTSLESRYSELKNEMLRRGYKPVKQFILPDMTYLASYILAYRVDRESSLKDLLSRCSSCLERWNFLEDSSRFCKQ